MRIALLATHFADYSLELARELAAEHEVLLIADRDKLAGECGTEQIAAAARTLKLMLVTQDRRDRRLLTEARAMLALSAFRPQIVVAHEHAHPHVTRTQRHAARISRLLLIVHDPEPHQGRDSAFATGRSSQIETQRRQAHHLFAHGAYCAGRLRLAVGPAKAITSIPHGPIMRPDRVGAPPGGRRLLMFGRMEAYKGLDLLLDACGRLAADGRASDLHLAGQGPELDRLHDAFAALPGCSIDRRYMPRDEVISAMAAADVVVAPYREATQSGVMAAAFANGRPVLATRVGGLPDFVKDGVNGRLIAPDDPAALADAIANWPKDANGPAGTLWAGALASTQLEMHWRVAAKALVAAADG